MIESTPNVSTEPEQNITEALTRRSTRQKTRIVYPKYDSVIQKHFVLSCYTTLIFIPVICLSLALEGGESC